MYHLWIEDLPSEEKLPPLTRTENQKLLTYGHSTHDSLPKLGLKFFCGDSLYLSCWSPLCKSIVHDTQLTLQEKTRDILMKKPSLQFKAIWLHWGFLLESTAGKDWNFKPFLVAKVTRYSLKKTLRIQSEERIRRCLKYCMDVWL